MKLPGLRNVRQFLRSPKVIVGEIVAILLAGVLGATFPQMGAASDAEIAKWLGGGRAMRALIKIFSLDHVFQSEWFLFLLALAAASLSIVLMEQVRRVRVSWACRPTEAQFRRAPYRTEFERPARAAGAQCGDQATVKIRTEGRIGIIGSPLFHFGLLLVIVAGAARSLYSVDAIVDLIEGETLPPTARAWAAQWPGALAKPFRLDCPVTVTTVRPRYYKGGGLTELSALLSFAAVDGIRNREIAINREVAAPGGRLFTDSNFGPAALLEWQAPGARPVRQAVLLAHKSGRMFEGSSAGAGGLRAHLRAGVPESGDRPAQVDVRVLDGPALLFAGAIQPGEQVRLPQGRSLQLHGMPFWARLHGSRDPVLWLAYCGFALVLAGATLMFAVVRADTCIRVSPRGDRELVCVALKPERFAPLFRERFQRIVREEGGPA